MSPAKHAAACAATAFVLCACGTTSKPEAGSPTLTGPKPAGHGAVDDPRARHIACLRSAGLAVTERGSANLLIGTPPNQVNATFTPTPGAAQEEQITAHVQSAEVIGSALLYPGDAPDSELQKIENCLAVGVKG